MITTNLKPVVRHTRRLSNRLNRRLRKGFWQVTDQLLLNTPLGNLASANFCARVARAADRTQVDDIHRLRRFWQQSHPELNYFRTPPSSYRSETTLVALRPYIDTDYSIMEVGCNVGRNLNHLYKAGYKKLAGIEISAPAVERLRGAYPELSSVKVDIGPAEEILPRFPANSFDVIFTMAVLEHIHPDSRLVFSEIARVAAKYVLAIEPRDGNATHRQYPWNVVKEFETVGLRLLERKPWKSLWPTSLTAANEWNVGFDVYDAMLFSKEDGNNEFNR